MVEDTHKAILPKTTSKRVVIDSIKVNNSNNEYIDCYNYLEKGSIDKMGLKDQYSYD